MSAEPEQVGGYSVRAAAEHLVAALDRDAARASHSLNVRDWHAELKAALTREATPPAGEPGA